MHASPVLYTPEILGLAVGLAQWPYHDGLGYSGEARSRSCGSTLRMGLELDADARIVAIGLRPQACAIGQAAASIFAKHAQGKNLHDIMQCLQAIHAWLQADGSLPVWDGFSVLEPAKAYPARHGAIVLPWQAAVQALETQ